MNRYSRLVSAQGPTQLINVLAILRYQLANESFVPWQDHLVLGGFYTEPSQGLTKRTVESCLKIAESWKFKSVHYLSDQELSVQDSFFDLTRRVEQIINLQDVGCLYVCRNWQNFNEVLLAAFEDFEKICYGDGFGTLDLNDDRWQSAPINPKGYQTIDKAYLFMPVEIDSGMQSFSSVAKIIQPPIEYLIDFIKNVGESHLKEIREGLFADLAFADVPKNIILVTTSNLAEAGCIANQIGFSYASFKLIVNIYALKILILLRWLLRQAGHSQILDKIVEKSYKKICYLSDIRASELEALMYFKQVSRYTDKKECICIKPHPRENFGQSLRLAKRLSDKGYRVILLNNELYNVPAEILFGCISFSKCIALGSTSALFAALLGRLPEDQIIPFIDADIQEQYYSDKYKKMNDPRARALMLKLFEQAKSKKFSPIRLIDC